MIVTCPPCATFKNWIESNLLYLIWIHDWLNSVRFTDCHGIAAFISCKFVWLCPTYQRVNNKLSNCLDLLLTNVSDVTNHLVDPHLANSDHSSISFTVKMCLKNATILFYRKVYLKLRVDWLRVGDDLLNHNWSVVYNVLNLVCTFMTDVIFSLFMMSHY